MAEAFASWSGPRHPKLLLVGEAFGESEDKLKLPFIGYSGKELFRMLGEAFFDVEPKLHASILRMFNSEGLCAREREHWLAAASIAMTNVFNFRPLNNEIKSLCVSKKELPPDYPMPLLSQGKYVSPQYLPELERLSSEILESAPTLVMALGNTPLWALRHETGIGKMRGTVLLTYDGKFKMLPAYHPAAIVRQWGWRPILVADLLKAKREMQFPEIRRPKRRLLVQPTLQEVRDFVELYTEAEALSVDVETAGGYITMVGFAISPWEAIVIDFFAPEAADGSYWPEAEEREVWQLVQTLLSGPSVKIFQNGLYDMQYFYSMGLKVHNALEDTMLLHHSIFPEMQKSLGFMGSIYTDEAAWKLTRRAKNEELKRDE